MQLSHRQILGIPVETKSGQKLGVVVSFEIDSEQQIVSRYVVKPALVPRILASELIINAVQVISLTNEKLIVEDSVVSVSAAETSAAI